MGERICLTNLNSVTGEARSIVVFRLRLSVAGFRLMREEVDKIPDGINVPIELVLFGVIERVTRARRNDLGNFFNIFRVQVKIGNKTVSGQNWEWSRLPGKVGLQLFECRADYPWINGSEINRASENTKCVAGTG